MQPTTDRRTTSATIPAGTVQSPPEEARPRNTNATAQFVAASPSLLIGNVPLRSVCCQVRKSGRCGRLAAVACYRAKSIPRLSLSGGDSRPNENDRRPEGRSYVALRSALGDIGEENMHEMATLP